MKNSIKKIRIFPTVTTISELDSTISDSSWKDKIKEICKFGIEEIALFPTCLNGEKRKELYSLLENSSVKRIPFVHLRSDMETSELEYLIRNYDTEVFNIHSKKEYSYPKDYLKFRDKICIENVYYPLDKKEIENFSGVCIDFSHLENDRLLYKNKYEYNREIIEKFLIKCNHISSIRKNARLDSKNKYDKNSFRYDSHYLKKLSELDYLKNYPLKYFSCYCAIELENSIERQLEIKDYIEELLNLKKSL
ncbi:MAG: hypothetical protein U9N04_01220 [Patescibacteria group bacterium]|nr:hypothetical protein [Patescibacteria group bacterium]